MSQNPSASRMAMVISRTLAIIGSLRETQSCFFRDSPLFLGAGRQSEGNGGPSAARLGCREPRSTGRDVARVGAKTKGGERSGVRLGRCCPVPDRDLFAANSGHEIHLNAWSSRKYVMVIPRGLIGISSLRTWDLKRKTKFAVYRSRF